MVPKTPIAPAGTASPRLQMQSRNNSSRYMAMTSMAAAGHQPLSLAGATN